MRLDGLHADLECARNLLVAVAFRDELHDLAFPRRETRWVSGRSGVETRQHGFGNMARKERTVTRERAYGTDDLLVSFRLKQIPARAGAESFADQFLALVHGEHQHFSEW